MQIEHHQLGLYEKFSAFLRKQFLYADNPTILISQFNKADFVLLKRGAFAKNDY